jgi:hypothetical protein
MFGDVFDMLFGCWHKRYSFPITTRKGSTPPNEAARVTGTYVVCLDCGKEFPYDWSKMKVLAEVVSVAPEEAETERIASSANAGFVKAA